MPSKFTLKGGKKTEDLRLDRVPRFDERSRQYAAVDVRIRRKAPRSYSWNFRKGNPNIDQGRTGGCTGASAGNELALPPAMVPGVNWELCEQLYWEGQRTDPWPGGAYPGASPRYEGGTIIDVAKAVRTRGYIGGFEWAFGIDDVILALGYRGPLVFGLRWYSGMFNPDEKGFIKPSGRHEGDHAIVGNAVNVKDGYVLLSNSWGAGWGLGGAAKISLDDLAWLLRQDGEACLYTRRVAKPKSI